MSANSRHIVVIGGGIIGCSTAYYLTRHPSFDAARDTLTLLEPDDIAGAASGKAGGLVATWAYPRELAALSYTEHASLAAQHEGGERWGYRVVGCGTWEGRGVEGHEQQLELEGVHDRTRTTTRQAKRKLPENLTWLREDLTKSWSPFGGQTAQVHPRLFTTAMFELAQERGAKLVKSCAKEVVSADGVEEGVKVVTGVLLEDGSTVTATHVVVAAGPWAPRIGGFPTLPVEATRAHSITLEPTEPISAHCVFTEISMPGRGRAAPEIYCRPSGEVYACSGGPPVPLPQSSSEVQVDSTTCDAIFKQVGAISSAFAKGKITARQACYLPSIEGNSNPLVGSIQGFRGLVVGVGHTCWGICNAPGTGRALAELVLEGRISCANLDALKP